MEGIQIRKNTFIPTNYLDESDKSLLDETKKRISSTNNQSDLQYYEQVLDSLMKRAYKQKMSEIKE